MADLTRDEIEDYRKKHLLPRGFGNKLNELVHRICDMALKGVTYTAPEVGKLTDERIMNAACTAADALDATRVSEMRAGGWHATTIFDGDSGLLRFGRLIEKALRSPLAALTEHQLSWIETHLFGPGDGKLSSITYCHVCGNNIEYGHMENCVWAKIKALLSNPETKR